MSRRSLLRDVGAQGFGKVSRPPDAHTTDFRISRYEGHAFVGTCPENIILLDTAVQNVIAFRDLKGGRAEPFLVLDRCSGCGAFGVVCPADTAKSLTLTTTTSKT